MNVEKGQVLVLAVFAFAALTGFVALTADVGLAHVAHQHAQNAADAAALAGCPVLPNRAEAGELAREWAGKNGADSVDIEVSDSVVGITVHSTSPALFGRVVGVGDFTTDAVAAATRDKDGECRLTS